MLYYLDSTNKETGTENLGGLLRVTVLLLVMELGSESIQPNTNGSPHSRQHNMHVKKF